MKKNLVIGIVVVAVIAMNFTIMLGNMNWNQGMQTPEISHHIFPKDAHDPIRINNDNDFTSANGVTGGSGTASDPYKITGWSIDASNKGAAIYIGNVTKNFTIANCSLSSASGGDGSVYFPNAGIVLYNIKNEEVDVTGNDIHYNDYGIYINNIASTTYINIGNYNHPDWANHIHSNYIDGINITGSDYGGITVRDNVIYRNNIGMHAYQNSATGFIEINYNGFGLNTHEAIKIEGTNHVDVYENSFYKNDGSTDHYDPNHPQATQDSSSTDIYWHSSDNIGNFWYDWAENNNTNYDMMHNNFVIPWSYPIKDVGDYSVVRSYDNYPVKGLHHDALKMPRLVVANLNPSIGYVGTASDGAEIITGLEINGTKSNAPQGYGLRIDHFINGGYEKLKIDGLIIHNVTSLGSNYYWIYQGNGIVINTTDDTGAKYVYLSHLDIYNCHANGIGINNTTTTDIFVEDTWIHDGAGGATGLFVYHNDSNVVMYDSTIEHQGHWGVFIGGNNVTLKLLNNIIAYNYVGVNMPQGLDKIYIGAFYNSFFRNSYYAISLKNSTNSNMSFSDNIFYENHGSGDSYSPSTVQVYAEKHSNYSNYNFYNKDYGNYYHDWVNNNNTNDLDNNGYVDWSYSFDEDGVKDDMPIRWVSFMNCEVYYDSLNGYYSEKLNPSPLYVDSTNIENLRDRGTSTGIIGYDGTYYYIVGWGKTENYTDSYNLKYGIYIEGNSSLSFKISNVLVNDSGMGINVRWGNEVNISKATVFNINQYEGIMVLDTSTVSISYSEVYDSKSGIELYRQINSANIYENRVYGNIHEGIYIALDYTPSGYIRVHSNYLFGNMEGLRGYQLSKANITNNGFAYNTYYGVKLESSNGNHIYGNVFYYNNGTKDKYNTGNKQAYDDSTNYWNSSNSGNYWHDFSVNNKTNDNNHDDIIDYTYPIAGGNDKDNYPQKYMQRNPVSINNTGKLNWEHGYVGGNGSSKYPYLIVGWDISHENGYGMYLANVSDSTVYMKIDNCFVNDTSGAFLSYMKLSNLEIDNTVSINNIEDGIGIEYSWHIVIINATTISNHQNGIRSLYSDYIRVYDSNMSENRYQGFESYGSYGIDLENNTFYNNGQNGVNMEQTYNPDANLGYGKIVNNTFKLNTKYGVKLTGSSGFIIYHNIFDRNNGASGDGTYDPSHKQAYDDAAQYKNLWNTTSEGNCWSDNSTSDAYSIDGGSSKDYHPGCGFVPELNSIFIAIFLAALLGVILRRKH